MGCIVYVFAYIQHITLSHHEANVTHKSMFYLLFLSLYLFSVFVNMCKLWNSTLNSGGAPSLLMHIQACVHANTHTCTRTLWKAAWLLVKASLLQTGPEREGWSLAKQDSYKVKHGRPRHVCRDLKALSPKLCLDFVHCSSWTVHRKAFSRPFSVHSFFAFHFLWLGCFLTVDSIPVY